MSILTNIDNTMCELTDVLGRVNGAVRANSGVYATIGNVRRLLFSCVPVFWERYALKTYFVDSNPTETIMYYTNVVEPYAADYVESGLLEPVQIGSLAVGTYLRWNGADYKYLGRSEASNNLLRVKVIPDTARRQVIGDYIDTVSSADPNAYPVNGAQDGYWYVKI